MISTIDVNKFIKQNNLKGPVSTPQIFMGKTLSFHPEGLFSEEIFGLDGSPERNNSISWIDLNCNVIQPSFYDLVNKKLFRKINELLSGQVLFSINPDGTLSEDPEGEIDGFGSFVKNIDRIHFTETKDEGGSRNKLLSMIDKNIKSGLFFTDKLLVISPAYRPVVVGTDQRDVMIDELNEIYRKVSILSNQLRGISGTMHDILSYKMQLLIRDLYEFIKNLVAKKQGIIRNLMIGKRVDFSARAVITPNPKLRLGEVGVPLNAICSIFEPYMIYALANSPESGRLPDEFHTALKDFLGKEVDSDYIL